MIYVERASKTYLFPNPFISIQQLSSLTYPLDSKLARDLLKGTFDQPYLINLSKYPANPNSTKNKEELILLSQTDLRFSNRWALQNALIDYTTVRFAFWNKNWLIDRRLALTEQELTSLKKMKVCQNLSAPQMTNLLGNLHLLPSLEQLEIDHLQITLDVPLVYTLNSLQLLSIYSIKVTDTWGNEVRLQKWLAFIVPKLKWVYLG